MTFMNNYLGRLKLSDFLLVKSFNFSIQKQANCSTCDKAF